MPRITVPWPTCSPLSPNCRPGTSCSMSFGFVMPSSSIICSLKADMVSGTSSSRSSRFSAVTMISSMWPPSVDPGVWSAASTGKPASTKGRQCKGLLASMGHLRRIGGSEETSLLRGTGTVQRPEPRAPEGPGRDKPVPYGFDDAMGLNDSRSAPPWRRRTTTRRETQASTSPRSPGCRTCPNGPCV